MMRVRSKLNCPLSFLKSVRSSISLVILLQYLKLPPGTIAPAEEEEPKQPSPKKAKTLSPSESFASLSDSKSGARPTESQMSLVITLLMGIAKNVEGLGSDFAAYVSKLDRKISESTRTAAMRQSV